MANNVNLPAQGTGDTTPKVSTDQVSADSSQVQNFQIVSVAGGVLTRNPTVSVLHAAASQADGHSANIGALSDAASASTLTGLLKNLKAALAGTIAVSGTFWQSTQPVSLATPTSGGYTVSRLLSAASTNATSVKGSAGQVYGWHLYNNAGYPVFFKLYNKASSPTVGTDTPFMTIPLPAGAAANVEFMRGIAMGTGVAFAITKLVADADTTAVAANDLIVNLLYA